MPRRDFDCPRPPNDTTQRCRCLHGPPGCRWRGATPGRWVGGRRVGGAVRSTLGFTLDWLVCTNESHPVGRMKDGVGEEPPSDSTRPPAVPVKIPLLTSGFGEVIFGPYLVVCVSDFEVSSHIVGYVGSGAISSALGAWPRWGPTRDSVGRSDNGYRVATPCENHFIVIDPACSWGQCGLRSCHGRRCGLLRRVEHHAGCGNPI